MPDYEIRIRVTGEDAELLAAAAVYRIRNEYLPAAGFLVDEPRLVNPPGSTIEQLPPHLLDVVLPLMDDYESTACQTRRALLAAIPDHPELAVELVDWAERMWRRCRANHKFTGQPCQGDGHPTSREASP